MGVLPSRVFQISAISSTRIRLPFRENQTGLTAPPENSAQTEMSSFLSTDINIIIVIICPLVKWRNGPSWKGQKELSGAFEQEGSIR